jgi:hypothetical protein
MHRSKKFLLIVGLILLFVTIAAAVTYHVIRRPAKAIYLLPDGNVMAYVNFTPLHFLNLDTKSFASDPQYQDFTAQTGFHFEHDLDNVAISGSSAGELTGEASAIFTGTFDQERLTSYVQKQPGVETESYSGKKIFFMHEGNQNQTVRVCILDGKTVIVTAGTSPESMHGIIDKSSGSGQAPSLLQDHYSDVPFGSVAWAIVRVPDSSTPATPGGFNFDFLKNSVTVMSVRYSGSVRVRAEFISENQADATHVFQAVNGFVAFARATQGGRNADKDVAALIDNVQLQQNGNRVVLNVVVPQEVVQKISASR